MRWTRWILMGALAGYAAGQPGQAQTFEKTSKSTDYKYVFYLPGKAPSAGAMKPLRLYDSSCVSRLSSMSYAIQVSPYQEKNVQTSKGQSSWSKSQSEYGTIRYIPRLTLTTKNAAISGDQVLVIEYFSCDASDRSNTKREMVEHIPLIKLGKGESIIVDGMGVAFFKHQYEYKGSYGYTHKNVGGKELYGFIVSLFNADGTLAFQQFSPQPLDKFCSKTMPDPQLQDKSDRPEGFYMP